MTYQVAEDVQHDFALNEKNYLILCLYIQVDKIIYQVRGFSEMKKRRYFILSRGRRIKKNNKTISR